MPYYRGYLIRNARKRGYVVVFNGYGQAITDTTRSNAHAVIDKHIQYEAENEARRAMMDADSSMLPMTVFRDASGWNHRDSRAPVVQAASEMFVTMLPAKWFDNATPLR